MGLVLSGSVHIIKEDFWGTGRSLGLHPLAAFRGKLTRVSNPEPLEVGCGRGRDCRNPFLDARRIITVCTSACEFHTRLIQNLLSVLAEKKFNAHKENGAYGQENNTGEIVIVLV